MKIRVCFCVPFRWLCFRFSRVFSYRHICFFGVDVDVLLHFAYFRLVNLFRFQSFILLNVCRNYFSFRLGDSKFEIIFALCAMGFPVCFGV